MRNRGPILLTGLICLVAGYMLNSPWVTAQGHITSISAIPNQKGGQDVFGGYEVVQGWPKDLASIPGHEQWTFGAGSPKVALVAAMVTNHVEDTLDDLHATPDQRTRILAVKDRMLADAQQLHGDRKATHEAFLDAWKSDAPDAAKLHALVDQRVEEMRKLAHEAVDAGVEVHGILTPDQRAQLTKKIERWHR